MVGLKKYIELIKKNRNWVDHVDIGVDDSGVRMIFICSKCDMRMDIVNVVNNGEKETSIILLCKKCKAFGKRKFDWKQNDFTLLPANSIRTKSKYERWILDAAVIQKDGAIMKYHQNELV